jgi:hypothetical protein
VATSNTVTFRLNRDQIIQQALIKVGALDPENPGTATTSQTTNTSYALNMMIKGWETEGLQLWERKYAAIFPQKSQPVYVLGSPGPGGDHATLSTPLGTGFIRTTTTSSVAVGATSITVTANSNSSTVYASVGMPAITMAINDNIGLQQTDGTMFWTTISNVVGTTITLTTGPTVGCASGAYVTTYTTKLMRPLRILDGFTRQVQGNDVPHLILPREQYNRFGMKTSAGTPIQQYYDVQENVGHLYFYPTCNDVTQIIFIEFQKPIDDFVNATDDFDMPQEWGEAIVYNLAMRLIPDYSVPKEKADAIKEMATYTFKRLDGWDQEVGSVYIQPSQWAYMGTDGGSYK